MTHAYRRFRLAGVDAKLWRAREHLDALKTELSAIYDSPIRSGWRSGLIGTTIGQRHLLEVDQPPGFACRGAIHQGRRETEGDAPRLLEGIAVVAFDRDTGAIEPDLPPVSSGLRWQEFIDSIAMAYGACFGEV